MNKFLFKSSDPDLSKLYINRFDMILKEQQLQRGDLATLTRMMNRLINDINLQKQVDDYYPTEDIPEHEDKEPD